MMKNGVYFTQCNSVLGCQVIQDIRGLVTSQVGQNDVKSQNMEYLCKY